MKGIELVTRGVFVKSKRILLTYNKKKKHYYLPGGHIELGESAEQALVRELHEETGLKIKVMHFLGVCEHCWKGSKSWRAEINIIFLITCRMLGVLKKIQSREKKISFTWYPLEELSSINFQPHVLRTLLPRWLAQKKKSVWASTF